MGYALLHPSYNLQSTWSNRHRNDKIDPVEWVEGPKPIRRIWAINKKNARNQQMLQVRMPRRSPQPISL